MIRHDSAPAWVRLGICLALGTIGGVGMWSVVVVLPAVQADFAVDRGVASLAYTASMLGVAFGSVLMGRLVDRYGLRWPAVGASLMLSAGYVLGGFAPSLGLFMLAHFALIGLLGGALMFGPLMANISLFFHRRRGAAVAICAAGNYFAGVFWPPILQHFIVASGWRATYIGVGLFCALTMAPLAFLLRASPPAAAPAGLEDRSAASMGISTGVLQILLIVAGFACCIAMSTPQVQLVAYCSDLGYGAANGAKMLSAMLAFGLISRIGSGWLADRIGGVRTLLLGSVMQGATLLLYVRFSSLSSLYVISALFGLVQGGIVPSYAVVVRECFPAKQAGGRIGLVLMFTMFGMAAGGWLSGAIDDWTGSYRVSFAVGVLWNALNVAIVLSLLLRQRTTARMLPARFTNA